MRVESFWSLGNLLWTAIIALGGAIMTWIWSLLEYAERFGYFGYSVVFLLSCLLIALVFLATSVGVYHWNRRSNIKEKAVKFSGASLKLLYKSDDVTPERIDQSNVFRYYSLVNRFDVAMPDGSIRHAATTILFVVFQNPISDGAVKIRFSAPSPPPYEVKDFSNRHVLVAISGSPKNYSVELETY